MVSLKRDLLRERNPVPHRMRLRNPESPSALILHTPASGVRDVIAVSLCSRHSSLRPQQFHHI
jgi:hypothetical protein